MATPSAFETLVNDANAYELQAQLAYLVDYLDSPGAADWRARLTGVDFEVGPWLAEAARVRDRLLELDLDAEDTVRARSAESLDLGTELDRAKAWLGWVAFAVARRARRPGGLGPRVIARVDVGAIANLSATAARHKILRVLRGLEEARLSLDPAQLAKGARLARALAGEQADGSVADARRHRLTVRAGEAKDDAKEVLRDLSLARDEVVAVAERDFPGLKLGILAAAAAAKGRRVPEEEDVGQLPRLAPSPGSAGPFAPSDGPFAPSDGPFAPSDSPFDD